MAVSGALLRLHGLSSFLEVQGTLEDNLCRLAETAAHVIDARNCSIMLLSEGHPEDLRLRVCAAYGRILPQRAYTDSVGKDEGIAGRVLSAGEPILVENIERSEFSSLARYPGCRSFISAPIVINRKIVGVVNADTPETGAVFSREDLELLEVVALFVGKSIQVIQLQNVLNSRFAQMALAQETEKTLASALGNPDLVARILAKSFFKEMTRAGFGSRQIINAASEIISLLSRHLQKHSQRMREDHD